MISRRLLDTGRARGHDIRRTTVRPRRRPPNVRPDVTLLIDVFNHGHTFRSLGAWRAFGEHFLEELCDAAPFVHLSNAYVDVCNLPYLPCSGDAAPRCPFKPLALRHRVLLRDVGKACFAERHLVRRLYEASVLNVFLSPLHQAVVERILHLSQRPPAFILKPLIDTQLFHDMGLPRDIENLFVGVISEAKGLDTMRQRFRDTDIYLVGRVAPGTSVDFGHHVDHVPYDEIPRWMNRAKNFVFLPRWPEAQGRVVAEAALCGCNIVGNENVGALSFDFDLADPSHYQNTEETFWKRLESLV